MSGLTISELHGRVPPVPLLDRLSDGNLDALSATCDRAHDLRGYVGLIAQGGFPNPSYAYLPPNATRGFAATSSSC